MIVYGFDASTSITVLIKEGLLASVGVRMYIVLLGYGIDTYLLIIPTWGCEACDCLLSMHATQVHGYKQCAQMGMTRHVQLESP